MDGSGENEGGEAATGEVNMSERSVGGGAAKTAPNTPAAAAATTAAAVVNQEGEPPKSPMEEEDVEEADVEEDEPSSDENEDGDQPSLSKSSAQQLQFENIGTLDPPANQPFL